MFVLGHVGKPYQLLDYEDFKAVTNNGELQKATKAGHIQVLTYTVLDANVNSSSGSFACKSQCQKSRPS